MLLLLLSPFFTFQPVLFIATTVVSIAFRSRFFLLPVLPFQSHHSSAFVRFGFEQNSRMVSIKFLARISAIKSVATVHSNVPVLTIPLVHVTPHVSTIVHRHDAVASIPDGQPVPARMPRDGRCCSSRTENGTVIRRRVHPSFIRIWYV